MIDLYPFSGFPVAVLGLGPSGIATARSLAASGAEVMAWDDDPNHRVKADQAGVTLHDLATIDWRVPVTLVLEAQIPHAATAAHPWVVQARAAGCEVVSDCELLARAQRDAAYIAVVSRRSAPRMLDLLDHVFNICGRELEAGGDASRPLLTLASLENGGTYAVDMPPGKADSTVSITFDCAVFLDIGNDAWPPCTSPDQTLASTEWVFHRQTEPKAAIIDYNDWAGREVFTKLSAAREQVLIPISGNEAIPHGVYVHAGHLYDATEGEPLAVVPLELSSEDRRLAAAGYATAIALDVPRHAAMASLRSFFEEA